jgi:hypothetical protein
MGMYTELCLGVWLKPGLPDDIVRVLTFMAEANDNVPDPPHADHPLFRTERWRWMLQSGGSYYFDAQPCLVWKLDDISKSWFLTVLTNIKNYSREWECFLDFLAPYVDASEDQYLGTYRYEESDRPSLLFYRKGRIVMEQPLQLAAGLASQ